MAAVNFTPIQLYHSLSANAVPTAPNLAQGELAININDGKLYYEDNLGVVQVIATKGAGTIGGSTTQIQYNNAGALAGNAAMVFNNSTNVTTLTTLNLTNALGAIYGGTAQSTYAQGDIVYASAANTLAKLGIGTTNYILTSSGSIPQWVAPSSIAVLTATNLDGGAAGSVPYQSGVATTTFLAIGAANRVMTSTGTAPQWVTSLTGLTGVSSSSITDSGLTSGRVTFASTSGLLADSANLTFNGTTLTTAGLSNSGFSTLVKTLTLGDTSFNGTAVFAPTTPAKLYMGTGTVTDVTSAISATNTTGAISSLDITPIAATNTGVTYTNASTLYIAGAPSAGTNVTITNPFALYVAGGAVNLGGNTAVTGTLTASGGITSTGNGDTNAVRLTATTVRPGGFQIVDTDDSESMRMYLSPNSGNGRIVFAVGTGTDPTTVAERMSILTANGNVLIGNTVAVSNAKLEVTGDISATNKITVTGGDGVQIASTSNLTWGASYGAGVPTIAGTTSTGIKFYPTGSTSGQVLDISSTGLAVTGTLSATGTLSGGSGTVYSFSGSAAANSLTLTSGGDVGVGTASPLSKLNVTGSNSYTGAGLLLGTAGIASGYIWTTDNFFIKPNATSNTVSGTVNIQDFSGTTKINFNSGTGSIGIGGRNAVTTGVGITFPTVESASSDPNTLDDYEEGIWVPTVTNMTTTGSPSYAGEYTKIGNLVLVNFYSTNAVGTTYTATADSTNVTGLPFTTKNTSTAYQPWTGTSGNGATTAGGTVGAAGNNTLVYFMTSIAASPGISFTLLYLV